MKYLLDMTPTRLFGLQWLRSLTPVVFDAPMGHLTDNRALPLGRLCTLKVTPTEAKIQVHGKTQ